MTNEAQTTRFIIGADENGLGARLGPMLVTAVLAETSEAGVRFLRRPLPKRVRADLDDSKKLISFGDHGLGEAWARALFPEAQSPADVFRRLNLTSEPKLRERCPKKAERQCWSLAHEQFSADQELVNRLGAHLRTLRTRGVNVITARTEALCVRQLNDERRQGANRFTSDLHAMERLILSLRETAGAEVRAVCGKVGGIADYEKFFGPLSGRLRVCLEQSRAHSAYRFPGLGEVHFVRDADASDPLVMLASLIGKYARELLMSRISEFYVSRSDSLKPCSGYHDPVTTRFIQLTSSRRRGLGIPNACFERQSDA